MEKNAFSLTALGTAFMHGYHARFDHPQIFYDPLAYGLLTEKERFLIGQNLLERLKAIDSPQELSCLDEASALRRALQVYTGAATVLSRAKYADEALEKAIGHRAKQYVILGAGMDTFAFKARGEPLKTGFAPASLGLDLDRAGLRLVEDLALPRSGNVTSKAAQTATAPRSISTSPWPPLSNRQKFNGQKEAL